MSTVLTIEDLSIGQRGEPLVEHIDAALQAGELVALIGRNGSGKSTLIRTLLGAQAALWGRILVNGTELSTMSSNARARCMAVVLTGRPQAGLLDVRSVVSLGRQPWTGHFGGLSGKDRERVDEAMRWMSITELEGRALHQLSDGEAQRVMIARALVQDTPILLMDEPMAYMDLVNRAQTLSTLVQLARERGKAVLFSTHDLSAALQVCDRLVVLHGRKASVGTADELRSGLLLEEAFGRDALRFG